MPEQQTPTLEVDVNEESTTTYRFSYGDKGKGITVSYKTTRRRGRESSDQLSLNCTTHGVGNSDFLEVVRSTEDDETMVRVYDRKDYMSVRKRLRFEIAPEILEQILDALPEDPRDLLKTALLTD